MSSLAREEQVRVRTQSRPETGGPAAPGGPKRKGIGHERIERTLSYELGAHTDLRLEASGLRGRIDIPLTDRIVVRRSEGVPRSAPVRLLAVVSH